MRSFNFYYCSVYVLLNKPLLLLICLFLLACNEPNNEKQNLKAQTQPISAESTININTASAIELENLPQIGAQTAQEIVNYREKYGKFRKPEHLLLVRGISDQKFRQIRSFIKVE